mmetsp:Transcript_1582/g.2393  ORF Transcript_1582/g.2393 Transcript_1582/m.2393 type:complete len:140 (+) Transcript_1582:1219-1638(+)
MYSVLVSLPEDVAIQFPARELANRYASPLKSSEEAVKLLVSRVERRGNGPALQGTGNGVLVRVLMGVFERVLMGVLERVLLGVLERVWVLRLVGERFLVGVRTGAASAISVAYASAIKQSKQTPTRIFMLRVVVCNDEN